MKETICFVTLLLLFPMAGRTTVYTRTAQNTVDLTSTAWILKRTDKESAPPHILEFRKKGSFELLEYGEKNSCWLVYSYVTGNSWTQEGNSFKVKLPDYGLRIEGTVEENKMTARFFADEPEQFPMEPENNWVGTRQVDKVKACKDQYKMSGRVYEKLYKKKP